MSKAAIIYWSGTGNTETIAKAIYEGMTENGTATELFSVEAAPKDLSGYEKVAFGCPSMGVEVLEEDEFEPYFTGIEDQLAGKKIALFGAYGWGDGEWMRNWAERSKADQAALFDDGFAVQEDAIDNDACVEYGRNFAKS